MLQSKKKDIRFLFTKKIKNILGVEVHVVIALKFDFRKKKKEKNILEAKVKPRFNGHYN